MENASWIWGFVVGFGVMLIAHFWLTRVQFKDVVGLRHERDDLLQELDESEAVNERLSDKAVSLEHAQNILRADMAQADARVHATNKIVAELRGALADSQATEKKLRATRGRIHAAVEPKTQLAIVNGFPVRLEKALAEELRYGVARHKDQCLEGAQHLFTPAELQRDWFDRRAGE